MRSRVKALLIVAAALTVGVILTYLAVRDEPSALYLSQSQLNETWPSVFVTGEDIDHLPTAFGAAIVDFVEDPPCDVCFTSERYLMPIEDIETGLDYLAALAKQQGIALGEPFQYGGVRFEATYIQA